MKKILHINTIIFIILTIIFGSCINKTYSQSNSFKNYERLDKENEQAKQLQNFLMLRDPKTNMIPSNIRKLELKYAKTLPKQQEYTMMKGKAVKNVQSLTWSERGPNNIGGRTRAIGIDVKNTSIIIAGATSGGIWRSTNSGMSWSLVSSPSNTLAVTSIVQDTRSGKENTWYAGTGELWGREFNDKGATNLYLGSGIYKSTDDGQTWSLLSSTAVTQPQTPGASNFSLVNGLAIDPSNSSTDVVYAATLFGIFKSTDGGSTWNSSLYNGISCFYSEVAVTPTGIVYATLDSTSANGGIWKSTDAGSTWTKITPTGLTNFRRFVIGISPSNENIVYFFGETPGVGKLGQEGDYLSLFKYDNSNSTWTDLSSNLPSVNGLVGGLDSQQSYDLFVKVDPNNSDTVIIGGTNMYRSTNGFADNTATTWIGGYSLANDASSYPNHHPDCHTLIFQPGSNIIAYSGHDGGISETYDITANNGGNTPVTWVDLDSTYDVTQFYSVSLAPESGSNMISGGAQDNGNVYTSSAGLSSWTVEPDGGDGGYDIVAPIADNRIYAEVQNGGIFSIKRDNTYLFDFAPPSGTSNQVNQLFINPYALDPNNSSLLYYAGGSSSSNSGVWRNSDAADSNYTNIQNAWTQLTSTLITDGSQVSAIGISTANSANVVYYGTSTGNAYRIDNANTGSSPTVTKITSASFPSGAYVSWIAVDPTNSNNAMLLFSNYNVDRIWYTTDGGSTWTNESGNLNAATGPSVRSAEIFTISGTTDYLLATSTGVYYATTLNGGSTVWTQEATTTIGNAVCSMLNYRASDNTLAVATHGRGVFSAVVNSTLPVELVSFAGVSLDGKVNLLWQTATTVNNYGFDIERGRMIEGSNQNVLWENIGFVKGAGNSNTPEKFSFVDNDPLNGESSGVVEYRLKMIDNTGNYKYSNIVMIDFNQPLKFELSQNYPNPFNPSTTIKYQIPYAGYVTLRVYNILGQEAATLVNENKQAGAYSVELSADKYQLTSGIYFYKLNVEPSSITKSSNQGFSEVKKMLLLK